MYIRRLKICNFKSYRKETVLIDLSSGLNTFFGRNGAGKSNLFEAIRFVLSGNKRCESKYGNRLRFFNNECKKVSVELELVTDVGVYTLKKEMDLCGTKYFLDGSKIALKYFMGLLRNIGFPDSPEFYYVDRKLINNVILASNEDRLNFFISNFGKAISQTLREHKKLMSETEKHFYGFNSFEKVLEFTQILQGNSKDVELAKWKSFSSLQKRKEFLSLLTRYKALVASKNKLISSGTLKDLINYGKDAKKISQDLKKKKERIQVLSSFLTEQKKELLELFRKKHKVEFELQDMLKVQSADPTLKIDKKSLEKVKGRLSVFKSKKEDEMSALEKLKNKLQHHECERDIIIEKLGIESGQLPSPDWLSLKLKLTMDKIHDARAACVQLNRNIQVARQTQMQYQNQMKNVEILRENKVAAKSERNLLDIQHQNLQVKLNELMRKEFNLQSELINVESQFNVEKSILIKRIGKNTMNAMESVQKVVARWKEGKNELADGYYGMVVDNIDCDPGLNIAIDVSVGNLLLHHIIKNNEVGLEILKVMKLLDLPGEVSFIPLNRIKPKEEMRIENPNARPLLSALHFPRNVEKAIKFCFVNIFICRNMDVAVELARSYRCMTVTLEGEVISGSGVMNGGYRKKTDSLLHIYKKCQSSQNKIRMTNSTLADYKEQTTRLSDQINRLLSEIQKLESVKYDVHSDDMKKLENDIKWGIELINNLEGTLKKKELEVSLLCNQLNILQSLTQHGFDSERLMFLNKKIIDLKKDISKQNISVLDCEKKEDDYKKLFLVLDTQVKDAEDKNKKISLIEMKISNLNKRKEILKDLVSVVSERVKSTDSDLKRELEMEKELSQLLADTEKKTKGMHYSLEMLASRKNDSFRDHQDQLEKEIKTVETLLNMKSIRNKSWLNDKNLSEAEINHEMNEIKNKIRRLGKVVDKTEIIERISKIEKIASMHKISFKEACMMSALFTECNNWFENHTTEMISKLSDMMSSNYKVFFPNQGVHLSLETDGDELHTIHGLNMDIVTSGGSQLKPEALSGSQKTALVISTVLAFVKLLNFGICFFDEIDQFLSEHNIKLFCAMFSGEMKSNIQFFAASHKKQLIRESDALFLVKNFGNSSFVEQIDKEKSDPIALLQAATKDSSCSPEDETYSC